ncbi:tRNA-dihydrouridine synthase [bacterium]|jgi:tRNA-dihydrouridine synthase B|nr:tRNA-dihydrouridine synthase [bacterium]
MSQSDSKSFWDTLPRPIIGLAPMDGYSDSAFRRVCKSVNPTIVTYTEFTSADGLHHGAEPLIKKLRFDPSEQPVIAQIFGKNTETFVTAAKICEDMGFTGIDINMGCPSKKVVKSEHGVALRRNPKLAFELINALATATSLPISIKTRLGWDDASDLIEFGLGAQNAGANMICVHARTYKEPYNVPAQWEPVYAMKEALSIPILGNGGIESMSDGISKLGNLDGFLIGQATFGNPWIFSDTGRPNQLKDRVGIMRQHATYLVESKGELVGCREIRKHLLCYTKGFDGAKAYRNRLCRVESLDEIYALLNEMEQLYTEINAS